MPEKNAVGIVELTSIYKGFEVQDAMLKQALVEKLLARTICSGKYLILVRGEVGDVEQALEIAKTTGGFAIVLAEIISNIHENVFPALAGTNTLDTGEVDGLLILETFSVAAAIKAADYMVKEADIDLLRIHAAMALGGKGLVVAVGDIEALNSAHIPAVEYLKMDGSLAGYSLISRPHKDVMRDLL